MSIIALDIHPQCKFSCFAANDKQCVHHPHEIVPELNYQSTFADKRVLVDVVDCLLRDLKIAEGRLEPSVIAALRNAAQTRSSALA